METAPASNFYYTPLTITANALGKVNVPNPVSDLTQTTT